MKLSANASGLDGATARLVAVAGGAWKAPALAEMAPALEEQIRAKLAGQPRAKGILANLRVTVSGDELHIGFPDFAERLRSADFARGDLSAYSASLASIAARVAREALGA